MVIRLKKKRKDRRGFTLVELIAVIVILGIIALIAVPSVNGIIKQSKESTVISSTEGYIRDVEDQSAKEGMSGGALDDGQYTVDELKEEGYSNVSGTSPDNGYVVIENQAVDSSQLQYGDYISVFDGKKVIVSTFDKNSWTSAENNTYLAKVYYNPTTGTKCTKSDFEANLASYSNDKLDSNGNKAQTGLKDGCMIWYAYSSNDDGTVNMILNHNTTAITSITTGSSLKEALAAKIKSDTTNWVVSARAISVEEIASIVGNTSFNINDDYVYIDSDGVKRTRNFDFKDIDYQLVNKKYKFFWLQENTDAAGYKIEGSDELLDENKYDSFGVMGITGYWTSSIANVDDSYLYNSDLKYMWTLGSGLEYTYDSTTKTSVAGFRFGAYFASATPASMSISTGIRPVVTVSESVFK